MGLTVAQLIAQISVSGADQAINSLNQVGNSVNNTNQRINDIKPVNAGGMITDVQAAQAKLQLLEASVNEAREKLQTLRNSADAGEAVTGIPEAEAKLLLLEKSAQDAREQLALMQQPVKEGGGFFASLSTTVTHSAFSFLDLFNKVQFAAFGVQNMIGAAQGLGQALIGSNISMEQTEVGFETVLHSADAAHAEMKKLADFAAATPFEFPELANAEQQLLAFQFTTDQTIPLLTAIGDALSGLGRNTPATLDQVVAVFGQMNAAGKLTTQDLLQLTSVGINGFQILADNMGKPVSTIREMVTKGLIPAGQGIDILRDGMEKLFGGGMQKQSQTFAGLWSTIDDNVHAALRTFSGPIFDMAKENLVLLGKLVSSKEFQDFAVMMGEKVGGALKDVGNFINTNVMPVLKDLWAVINDEPFGMLLVNLGNLGHVLIDIVSKSSPLISILDTTKGGMTGLSGPASFLASVLYRISEVIDTIIMPILRGFSDFLGHVMPPIIDMVKKNFNDIMGVFDKLKGPLGNLSKAFGDLFEALGPVIGKLLDFYDKNNISHQVLDALGKILATVVDDLAKFVKGLADTIKYFHDNKTAAELLLIPLGALGGYFVYLAVTAIAAFIATLPEMIAGFIAGAAGAWSLAAGLLAAAAGAIILAAPFILLGLLIAAVIVGIILAIQHWGEISKWISDRWNEVVKWFQGFMGQLGAWFGGIGQWFADRFTEAKNGIMSAFGAIGKWFGDRWKEISNFFAGVGQWFSDRFTEAKNAVVNAFLVVVGWIAHIAQEIYAPFAPFVNYIAAIFQTIGNIIFALIKIAVKFIVDRWNEVAAFTSSVWNAVAGAVSSFLNMIFSYVSGVLTKVGNFIAGVWQGIQLGASIAWGAISLVISTVWNIIYGFISSKIEQVKNVLGIAWGFISTVASTVWGAISKTISDWWNTIYKIVSDKATDAKNFLMNGWNTIKNDVAGAWKWITDHISGVWNNVVKIISDRVDDVKNNILKPFNDAKDTVGGVLKGFVNNMIDVLNNGIGGVENFVNFFGDGLNNIAKSLGTTGNIPHVHFFRIAKLAEGGIHSGGPAIVGEEGPEMAFLGGSKNPTLLGLGGPQFIPDLPAGSRVLPNKETEQILSMLGAPRYAGGVGDAISSAWGWLTDKVSQLWNLVSQGAEALVNWLISSAGIKIPNLGPLKDIASGIFNNVKNTMIQWVKDHIPGIGGGSPSSGPVSGDLESWIKQAISLTGVPMSWLGDLETIAMHESGGNPRAQNNTDINAQNGDPSKGLMQTISATFNAYSMPNHRDIWNPVDNAAAAIRYILSRYGSVFNVPGIISMANGGAYQGYESGTSFSPGGIYAVGERGPEAMYIPRGAQIIPNDRLVNTGQTVNVTVKAPDVYLDGMLLTNGMMPHLVNAIRYNTGKFGM